MCARQATRLGGNLPNPTPLIDKSSGEKLQLPRKKNTALVEQNLRPRTQSLNPHTTSHKSSHVDFRPTHVDLFKSALLHNSFL